VVDVRSFEVADNDAGLEQEMFQLVSVEHSVRSLCVLTQLEVALFRTSVCD